MMMMMMSEIHFSIFQIEPKTTLKFTCVYLKLVRVQLSVGLILKFNMGVLALLTLSY